MQFILLWELCARGLSCSELWRESVGKRFHINVLEAKSYIKEEKRCGGVLCSRLVAAYHMRLIRRSVLDL